MLLDPVICIIALPIKRLAISPMPTGRSPGHLSRATPLFARSASRGFGSTYSVASLMAMVLSALQREEEVSL